jgi:hypothetical protein
VDEDASGQRKNLGFILQAAERCGENQAVVVALKLGSVFFPDFMQSFQSETLVRYELFPVHGWLQFFANLGKIAGKTDSLVGKRGDFV